MNGDLNSCLSVAIEAARAAETVINQYYHGDFDVQRKADSSPVTIADIESERAIKKVLSEAFPEHGFYGEELGQQSMDADYVWLIDPIDGTKSFVRGYPFFSTQIALMHKGELVVGVSNAPAFNGGEMAWAARGRGAFMNGERIRVSTVDRLAEANLSMGNIGSLGASPAWPHMGRLVGEVNRVRGYGDFYHYHLLASGAADVVIESDLNILDVAALSVIVQEAGGDMTELGGTPLGLKSRTALTTNGKLRSCITPYLAGWDESRHAPQG